MKLNPYICKIPTYNYTYMTQLIDTKKTGLFHLLAILTVGVWGTTFISTKVLIENGLHPQDIFFLRFGIAYIGIWAISPKKLLANNVRDEFLLFLSGLTGGSLYFLTENTALSFTQTTNVSFIICATPLLTTMLSRVVDKQTSIGKAVIIGSLTALMGVALLIFNGSFVLRLSPLGDFLTLCAALSWAFYSLLIQRMSYKYNTTFITRKVFFYGILTALPFILLHPFDYPAELFSRPVVWMNLAFLGILASLICFALWSVILKKLGTVQASNYLYLNPLFTMIAASLILHERITLYAICGVVLVLAGVFLASRKG